MMPCEENYWITSDRNLAEKSTNNTALNICIGWLYPSYYGKQQLLMVSAWCPDWHHSHQFTSIHTKTDQWLSLFQMSFCLVATKSPCEYFRCCSLVPKNVHTQIKPSQLQIWISYIKQILVVNHTITEQPLSQMAFHLWQHSFPCEYFSCSHISFASQLIQIKSSQL